MRVVTLARRPMKTSSAECAAEWGAASLNIDATRIAGIDPANAKRLGRDYTTEATRFSERVQQVKAAVVCGNLEGRWPANLILQHRAGCRQTGTTTAPGYTINRWTDGAKPFGGGAGHDYESEQQPEESVAVWECEEKCAVAALNTQAGVLTSGKPVGKRKSTKGYRTVTVGWAVGSDVTGYGDRGTAARYFKQVQEMNMQELPQELVDYLETMITPPDGEVLVALDLDEVHWEVYDDNQLHGVIAQGDPTPHMEEIWRVLRPGAHVSMIAPDSEPTGHTAACALEDKGFEIRDAILLVQEPGRIHYVAKCSTAERNAGIVPFERKVKEKRLFPKPEHLDEIEETFAETKTEQEIEAWYGEGAPRADIPKENRDWFEEREVEVIKITQNDHATVKPKDVMRRLLEESDLPKGSLVVDPFLGSGSTGIACIEGAMCFTGIELEMPSLQISEARIRHWDVAELRSHETEISSEAEMPKRKKRNFLTMAREKKK